jgi:hypothetical protein
MPDPEPKKKSRSLSDEAMAAAYQAEHRPTHDQKWAAIKPSDAPFVRDALIKAEALRDEGADPGDAYLQAIADFNRYRERLELLEAGGKVFEAPTAPPEVDLGS